MKEALLSWLANAISALMYVVPVGVISGAPSWAVALTAVMVLVIMNFQDSVVEGSKATLALAESIRTLLRLT